MDYVARAKALLVGKARMGALVVLPLAAAVNQANATVISLPTTNVTCTTNINGSGGSCTAVAEQLAPYNNVAGIGFGVVDIGNSVNLGVGISSLTLTTTGVMTGPSGGKISAGTVLNEFYNLSVTNVVSDNWIFTSLEDLTTSTTLFAANSSDGILSGSGLYSGYLTDTLLADAPVGDTYRFTIGLYLSGGDIGQDMVVTIPQGGLSMATAPSGGAVPEPSTLGFGALGLAFAGFWRRLRGKRAPDPK